MKNLPASIACLILVFARFNSTANEGGYLFVTFKGEQTPMTEQIYFAVSSNGRNWSALNNSEPVLVSSVGEKGVRDPYLLRSHDGKKFYLIATDLSINRNGDWWRAQSAGSKSVVIWESDDLVHWSEPRLVQVAPDDAGCTWAPEAVYDNSRGEYLTFWASRTGSDNFGKHRIWAAWTKDFVSFGKPFVYIDKPWDVIDTDIVQESGSYFRFSKDERSKSMTMEASAQLMGTWDEVTNFSLATVTGYEGPACYPIAPATDTTPAAWCLILDQYSNGTGYHPFVTKDLRRGQFTPGEDFKFPFHFRHGSVLPISTEEYNRLRAADEHGKWLSQGAGTSDANAFTKPRMRVIVDNDFGGDPDGLFALVQHLLSPSVETRGIIGSHQYPDGFYGYSGAPDHSCSMVKELLTVMNLGEKVPIYEGADGRIGKDGKQIPSEAARFIIREAMREDVQSPLYITCGAGLTDLASAYLMEPRIAKRIRLVWIGGHEHEGIAMSPPGGQVIEYNLGIDLKAAQVVFNESDIPIWQVPRDAYRQALVSYAELCNRMKEDGRLAGFLMGRLRDLVKRADNSLGEAYVLGDSPLVLLTALQSAWEVDPSSSSYTNMPTPKINDQGLYDHNPKGRPMRVYTHLDTRLMFEDFYAKVRLFDQRVESER